MLALFVSFAFTSCEEILDELIAALDQTGWQKDKEDMDNIPEDITPFDDNKNDLASRISLEEKFPPIGNQGQYGTCVAWSTGYNLKTALNAIEKGWKSTQLADPANQTSPKDLWMIIPSGSKGEKCDGTQFEAALDALIASGGATMQNVPYDNLGNCTGSKTGNSGNKLANYRKIASETEGLTVGNFKGYLNAGRPIAIGARLGDRFMAWNSSSAISSDTYNDPGMQHAYHAMVLVGYDDAKNAFRVRNSWGASWGDKGSIWVDYNFFCNSFCFAAFVAQNPTVTSIGNVPKLEGDDLLALAADDYRYEGDEHYTRTFDYQVYNSGTTTIFPSKRWTAVYMYYNAKNAKDYEIIFEDYYTNEYGREGDYDYLDYSDALVGGYWNNYTMKPGEWVGDDWVINYVMPKITGSYYLVLLVDAYDVIREVNEDNNFFFITAENGKPLEYVNGEVKNMPQTRSSLSLRSGAAEKQRPEQFGNTTTQTAVTPATPNAYTPEELKTMLLHDKKTGKLDAKIRTYSSSNAGKTFVKRPR
jgi:C1A family cysteine protease